MSTTVDSRVVEMRFDNKQFESNVSHTMSTLDKFKQKLNFSGSAKGLEDVGTAAKNVNMNGLGNAVQTVSAKFSSLQVMAVTALANITNSAVNAGKRMISALTIDPVKSGFQEYETQINAVQTILANTKSKGTTIDDVNRALDELNRYADMTIYNFTEMTRNIGTFTAAGVDLDTSVSAIQGIANLAAVSGSTSQQASTAMYQLSQALASGTVKLMDWNSVVNAGMGGELFQNALKKTSAELGTGAEAAIKASGSFRESLRDGWLTSEVLTETLKKFTTSGANEYLQKYTGLTKNQVEAYVDQGKEAAKAAAAAGKLGEGVTEEAYALEHASKAMAEKTGKNQQEIKDTLDLAETATNAATQVKTFSQLWDVLKESAQSGWSQSWKIIIGDFEEAKGLLTPLADLFTGLINKMSDARNRVLQIALDFAAPWKAIEEKLGNVKKVVDGVTKVTGKLEDFQKAVDDVWMGKYNNWGDTPDRRDLLKAAGYDPRVVQDLVNLSEEGWKSGKGYTFTIEEVEAAHKKYGLTMETTKEQTEAVAEAFNSLTDAELEAAGLTEEEIKLYRALEKEAGKLGISIDELADKMSESSGRDRLIESFKNIGKVIGEVFSIAKLAYQEIFNPPGLEELGISLFGLIYKFQEFTERLKASLIAVDEDGIPTGKLTETGEKIKTIFEGIFAVVDMVKTIIGGALKFAFKIVTGVLDKFGLSIFDVVVWISEAIIKFRDWFNETLNIDGIITKVVDVIHKFILKIKDFINTIRESEGFQKFVDYLERTAEAFKEFFGSIGDSKAFKDLMEVFKSSGQAISDWFKGLKDSDNIPRDIILGLINGLKDGIPAVVSAVIDLGIAILRGICECLGIHSPSVEFKEVGKNIIAGLVEGIKNGISWLLDILKGMFTGIVNFAKNFDLGAVLAGVIGIGIIATVNKFGDMIAPVTKGLGEMFEGIGEAFQGLGKSLKASAMKKKAQALMFFAISIGVLAGALFLISKIPSEDLWRSVGALGALVGILAVLAAALVGFSTAMDKLDKEKTGTKLWEIALVLVGIGASVLMFAAAVKTLGNMDEGSLVKAGLAIGGFVSIMAFLIGFSKAMGNSAKDVAKLLLSFSVSIFILAGVMGLFAIMPINWIAKGLAAIAGLTLIMGGLIYITSKYESKGNKVASTLMGVATAMTLMAGILWLMAPMTVKQIVKGELAMLGFVGIIAAMLLVTNLAKDDLTKVSAVILSIGTAMLLMALVMKLTGRMSVKQIAKGETVIISFAAVIAALIYTTKYAGKDLGSVAVTLLAAAAAISILAGVAILLGLIKIETLAQGITAVTLLGGLVAALMQSTRGLDKCQGSIIAMAVIIALLAGAVVGLSFIDPRKLGNAITALGSMLGMMSLMFLAAGTMKDAKLGPMIAMAVIVVVLAGVIWALSALKVNVAIETAGSLAILMLTMAGVVALLSSVGDKASKAYSGIFALLLMAIPLLGFVLVLRQLNGVTVSTETLVGLMALVTLMTLLLPLLALVGTIGIGPAMIGVLALTTMAVPLALFAFVLASMQNVQNAANNAAILMTLMSLMTLLLIPLALVGATHYIVFIGVLALLAMAVPMAAFVGVLALMQNIKGATANANLLIDMMGAMTTMLVALAPLAPLAILAATALTMMVSLMVTVGLLAVAIGALMTEFPQLQSFLDSGLPVMIQLAGGMGEMIGAFVAGIATQMADALPHIAEQMSLFMVNLQGFIEGAKTVDANVLAGVGIIAAAIIALSIAEFINAITTFLSGGASLPELGAQLSAFMVNALPFVATAMMIRPEMLEGVKALTSAILMLTGANLLESITSWLTGESSLATFAAQFPILGQGLRGFLDSVGTFTEAEVITVNCAANAIKILAQAADTIPNSGGWVGKIVGENDLGTFANQFPYLGSGLRSFLSYVGTFTDAEVATVDCGAQAIKLLAEAADEIPNQGGWLAAIIGDNTLQTFANQFPYLGVGLRSFINNVGTFTDAEVATVDCGAQAVKLLATAASEIPNSGGWWGAIVGENDLKSFAGQFGNLGTGLRGFLNNVGTFTEAELATVNCGAAAVTKLAEAATLIPKEGGWWQKIVGESSDLGTFAENFPVLGEGLAGFVSKLGTFDDSKVATIKSATDAINAIAHLGSLNLDAFKNDLKQIGEKIVAFADQLVGFSDKLSRLDSTAFETATTNINRIANLIRGLNGIKIDGAEDFAAALKALGNSSVDEFINAFKDVDASVKMETATKSLMDKAIDGIEAKKDDLATAGNSAADSAASALDTAENIGSFSGAGKNLVQGFANGISENTYLATAKARAMAKAAAAAAKAELDINSPSKVFRAIGYSIPEGLAVGIDNMGYMVAESSESMAKKAVSSVSKSIVRIADMVNTDIDSQPTIRPVLDLSDVEAGANTLSNMLNLGPSVGVLANVGSISSMMNQRTQTGTNADVVSAIDKLNKKMDNFGNTSYQINGVTYDDGSNISDAVKTIVRAARIERRV